MNSLMTIRAPEEMQRKLAEIAGAQGFTRNALVLMILQAWLREQEEKKEVERWTIGKDGTKRST